MNEYDIEKRIEGNSWIRLEDIRFIENRDASDELLNLNLNTRGKL